MGQQRKENRKTGGGELENRGKKMRKQEKRIEKQEEKI